MKTPSEVPVSSCYNYTSVIIADANFPLMMHSNLKKYTKRYISSSFLCRTYNNNSRVGVSEQANDCLNIMQYLGMIEVIL